MSTVLLLHGDARIAASLRELIDNTPGFKVFGIADSLSKARELLARGTPDLLLTDLTLPDGKAQSLLSQLRSNGRGDDPQLIVLAMSTDDPQLMDALCHGADAYFTPSRSPDALISTMRQVLNGESPIAPAIAREITAHFNAAAWDQTDFVGESQNPLRLADADELLLQMTADGFLVSEVAQALQTGVHAVGVRTRNIYRKLQFDVRADALTLMAA